MSSSSGTSRICFVPGLKSEQKESSSLSDAVLVFSLSQTKAQSQKALFKHLGF